MNNIRKKWVNRANRHRISIREFENGAGFLSSKHGSAFPGSAGRNYELEKAQNWNLLKESHLLPKMELPGR